VRKFGKNFKTIAEVLGTKTEAHVRSFYVNYKRRYGLGTSTTLKVALFSANVADPDLGSGAFSTPGSGMGIKSRYGIRIPKNIPDHIFEDLEIIFGLNLKIGT
jgi:hypothetical protein